MPLTFFQSKWFALPFYQKKKKKRPSNPLEFPQEWGNGRRWPPAMRQSPYLPPGLRPSWALGPALKRDGSRGVRAGGLSPGWGAGRAGCPAPWSLPPGQLLGSAFMERPQGSPQPPTPAGGDSGNRLPRVVEEIKWITADKAPGSCFCAWY